MSNFSRIRCDTAVERLYGPQFIVELQNHEGDWIPYGRDRKDRDEDSAKQLMARLKQRQPNTAMRVVRRPNVTPGP